ncbi:hypothetical protein [Winogradskyella alexanderae]|uniref:Uncharacterized protein n=1 Tax=Winogradskyella alexanderae TaxID=2877123 RepID=A0ABS7XSU8_9FLAO|nr:hypothetical protein [Winogradskyella alexanderae]MCA0132539.1 hypothetical protein [Winogradskyella alexanderae]
MRTKLFILLILITQQAMSQMNFGTPPKDAIPEKLKNLKVEIEVVHFPKENDPIKIDDIYYWKHSTAIMCKEREIKIIEYGAYLYYNDKWNLRKSYPLKDLDKTFGTINQTMLQAQPYVWVKNWRTDKNLYGGWAMWYFIGVDNKGITVCGYETVNTTNRLLNK